MWDESSVKKEEGLLFWKRLILTASIFVGVAIARLFIRDPYASSLAFVLMCSVFYWIPPRPKVTFGRWILKLIPWTLLIFLATTAYVRFGYHF